MTTPSQIIEFNPPKNSNFAFVVSLDGDSYNAVMLWNFAGQRYYIQLSDESGVIILNLPIIGSPDTGNISLVKGWFSDSLIFRQSMNRFEVFKS